MLTATAFHYFNEEKLDIGVIEVGMGGKLDATNILENQIVSVVSKIAMDHEGFLGSTLEEIAKHKAGILRQNVPYAISPANDDDVQKVIGGYAKEIGAGPRITVDSTAAFSNLSEWQDLTKDWVQSQKDNAALAVFATNKALQKFDLAVMEPKTILSELSRPLSATYPGRLQYHHASSIFPPSTDSSRAILIDGAHNPDAAKSLNAFVEKHERRKLSTVTSHRNGWPVTWILAMTNGKDASNFLNILLRPGDRVVTTGFGPVDGMPWVKSMPAAELLEAARTAQPKIEGVAMQEPGALKALFLAKDITYAAEMGELLPEHRPIVLTGSLYFVADYLREVRTAVVSMENT